VRGRSIGTPVAVLASMAAVLCLMFLPIFSAVLFMVGSMSSLSLGTLLAGATFALLAGGIFVGAMNMSKDWENA
jgi:hypothetical protein